MPGRKIADVDDARTCLELAAANGLTPSAWAYVNGIDGRSLHMWRLNLERTKAEGARSKVTELRLVELVADKTTSRSARYLVHIGDVAIEVDDQFDESVLRRLLAVVTAC